MSPSPYPCCPRLQDFDPPDCPPEWEEEEPTHEDRDSYDDEPYDDEPYDGPMPECEPGGWE